MMLQLDLYKKVLYNKHLIYKHTQYKRQTNIYSDNESESDNINNRNIGYVNEYLNINTNKKLKHGDIKRGVKYLIIQDIYNNPIDIGIIPNTVTHLQINPNPTGQFRELSSAIIPDSVIYLDLSQDCIINLKIGDLPNNLQYLKITHSPAPNVIPESVIHLVFNKEYYQKIQKIDKNVIPKNVKILEIKKGFNTSIDIGIIPHGVKYLSFEHYNTPIIPGAIPNSVTHIDFGRYFNKPLEIGAIPESVTHIIFRFKFNQPLYPGVIPNNVTHLIFENGFDQKLYIGSIPNSVVYLKLGNCYNQQIDENVIPESVVYLILGNKFNQPILNNTIPKSVKYLAFGINFSHELNKNNLPLSVKVLILGHYYDKYTDYISDRFENNNIIIGQKRNVLGTNNAYMIMSNLPFSLNSNDKNEYFGKPLYNFDNFNKITFMYNINEYTSEELFNANYFDKYMIHTLTNDEIIYREFMKSDNDNDYCKDIMYMSQYEQDSFYVYIQENMKKDKLIGNIILNELIQTVFNPIRLEKISNEYNISIEELLNIY